MHTRYKKQKFKKNTLLGIFFPHEDPTRDMTLLHQPLTREKL